MHISACQIEDQLHHYLPTSQAYSYAQRLNRVLPGLTHTEKARCLIAADRLIRLYAPGSVARSFDDFLMAWEDLA